MNIHSLQQLSEAAWRIIDNAGQRRATHLLSVTVMQESYSYNDMGRTDIFGINYRPLMSDDTSPEIEVGGFYTAAEALNQFELKISKL